MKLREDSETLKLIKSRQSAILSDLLDMDANYAESFIKWMHNLLLQNKRHFMESSLRKQLKLLKNTDSDYKNIRQKIKNVSHKSHPLSMSKGDIVHVKFGVNLGDELSDLDKDRKSLPGHYGLILAQKGFAFIIIPLTSVPQPFPGATFELNNIPGLPKKSFLLFNQIRAVNIRRLERIHGIPSGKIVLDKKVLMPGIERKLREFLCLNGAK